jgi:hypothetical protein
VGSSFFNFEPEIAGRPQSGVKPDAFEYIFDTWLGDDVVRPFPALLVTGPVRHKLLRLPQPEGFEVVRARAKASAFYRKHNPGRRLEAFWEVQIRGRAGCDDLGLTEAGVAVVSRRILDLFLEFNIARAVITQYAGLRSK